MDDKNIIVEIRAGAGGDEAGSVRGRRGPHVHGVMRKATPLEGGDTEF